MEWLADTGKATIFGTILDGPPPRRAVIRLVAAETGDAEERLRDWKQAATFSHPHLMRIFESGRANLDGAEFIYVVTEFAEEALSQVIPERPLTTSEARAMLVPVIDALEYLHSQGMVHGRIKPDNIMVVGDRLKIPVDSVRREGPSSMPQGMLQIHDAPEVTSGTILPASDVWSLGVTLVEALTQHPPVWNRLARRDPVVPAEVPEPFAGIARACLRYDAPKRATLPQIRRLLNPSSSLEEPANEIDQAAPPATVAIKAPRESSSRARLVLIAAAVFVAIAAILYALTRSHPSEPAPPTAQSPVPAAAPPPAAAPAPAATPAAAPPPSHQTPERSTGTLKGEVVDRVMPDVSEAANRTIQ